MSTCVCSVWVCGIDPPRSSLRKLSPGSSAVLSSSSSNLTLFIVWLISSHSADPLQSGLGLPTTRKIIEAHGGRIDVQSEVGRGTQFTIELPVPARLTAVKG